MAALSRGCKPRIKYAILGSFSVFGLTAAKLWLIQIEDIWIGNHNKASLASLLCFRQISNVFGFNTTRKLHIITHFDIFLVIQFFSFRHLKRNCEEVIYEYDVYLYNYFFCYPLYLLLRVLNRDVQLSAETNNPGQYLQLKCCNIHIHNQSCRKRVAKVGEQTAYYPIISSPVILEKNSLQGTT